METTKTIQIAKDVLKAIDYTVVKVADNQILCHHTPIWELPKETLRELIEEYFYTEGTEGNYSPVYPERIIKEYVNFFEVPKVIRDLQGTALTAWYYSQVVVGLLGYNLLPTDDEAMAAFYVVNKMTYFTDEVKLPSTLECVNALKKIPHSVEYILADNNQLAEAFKSSVIPDVDNFFVKFEDVEEYDLNLGLENTGTLGLRVNFAEDVSVCDGNLLYEEFTEDEIEVDDFDDDVC